MSQRHGTVQDKLTVYLARVGNRAWWAVAAIVLLIAVVIILDGAAGPLLIWAIQLGVLGLVVYVAVRLALRHG